MKQRLITLSSIAALLISFGTIVFTVGSLPFEAGAVMNRLENCEKGLDKIDQMIEDIAYIRGWVDSEKGK
jgi:hypothetical protein